MATLTEESWSDSDGSDLDQRAIRRAMQRRACEIERREFDRAIARLESKRDLTDEQRAVLAETAAAIAAGVLAGPDVVLAESELDDLQTAHTLLTDKDGDTDVSI